MSFRRTGKAQAPQQEEKKQEAPKSNKSSSSQGSSGKPTYHNNVLNIIVTGKQIGRASCRERVSSPV